MARAYDNPDDIQPRYAAWLGSIGLPVSNVGMAEALARYGSAIMRNIAFAQWIAGCRNAAPAIAVQRGRIVDHDAFTEHCWNTAFGDVQALAA